MDLNRFAHLSLPEAPVIKTPPPGPKSRAMLDYQVRNESSAVSYTKGMPMAIKLAKGATIVDADENTYIDMFGGAGVMAVGAGHPDVLKAAHETIDRYTHTLDFPTDVRQTLVEALREVLPGELTRIFFGGPTGSDAVEQAIKLAKYNTGRHEIIAFHGAYHGMTGTSLALSADASHRQGLGPLVPGVRFVPYDYPYRSAFADAGSDSDLRAADYLEMVLTDSHSGFGKPAAVILESVQGQGGTIIPSPRFMKRVREITKQHEIILICDEIQSGFCRTGKMFAFEHYGEDFVPDIITMSKALGGQGFPIAAIAFREELNTWPAGFTIGTFRGNMVAFAAGGAALRFMIDKDLPNHAAALGGKLLARLKPLEDDCSIVGEVRGIGLMLGIEIVRKRKTKEPASDLAKKIRSYAHQAGVMIDVGGHYGNVARLLPPLVITEDLAMKAAGIIMEAIRKVEGEV